MDFSVVLLHEGMLCRDGSIVTTSLTLIDIHDIARSAATYGVHTFYIVHPSPYLRDLAHQLTDHWTHGYGSAYNPNRCEALAAVKFFGSLDDVILDVVDRVGSNNVPKLIATSAKSIEQGERIKFVELSDRLRSDVVPHILMLGTGHGMCEELLSKAQYFLEPINGPTDYNHLSVRSACAIMLDRLFGV